MNPKGKLPTPYDSAAKFINAREELEHVIENPLPRRDEADDFADSIRQLSATLRFLRAYHEFEDSLADLPVVTGLEDTKRLPSTAMLLMQGIAGGQETVGTLEQLERAKRVGHLANVLVLSMAVVDTIDPLARGDGPVLL